ncbi:hypothetical protein PR048_001645 [Dryococelus australis]|uniref:Uncharacterized protein n=1 Tax=Dryococelus australis TaxID=614101 RepID=A0ABQ9IJ08_9NEOP|nr:hypothetical protein PR048_001645 [Dryococelus australis]
MCLFVCFAAKTIHLELMSDPTTETCLAAFHHFLSRCGQCSDIYSTCGTNFVGFNLYLFELRTFMIDMGTQDVLAQAVNEHQAEVKLARSLLIKCVGLQTLAYEELYIVMMQEETSLNSQPLCIFPADMAGRVALVTVHQVLIIIPSILSPYTDSGATSAAPFPDHIDNSPLP